MRRVILATACVAALAAAGCSKQTGGKQQLDVSTIKVTGTHPVSAGIAGRLAPNGDRVTDLQGSLCVSALDGSNKVCPKDKSLRPDAQNYAWSPDSKHVALTDDYFRALQEPDIWVMDAATGAVRDITDDGVGKWNFQKPDPKAQIDLFPSWSPDGETIRFARQGADKKNVELESIAASGGDVSTTGSIPGLLATTSALTFSPDGDKVAWTTGLGTGTVHIRDTKGGTETTVPGNASKDSSLLSFSPDGDYLLVDSVTAYASFSSTGGAASVIPLKTGKAEPVAGGGSVSYPSWAPHSDALAYLHLDVRNPPSELRVVDEPGGHSTVLRTSPRFGAPSYALSWASDDILAYENGKPFVLTLDK